MPPYSHLFVFNLQIYFYHQFTLFIWHKCPFQPFISPHIPIAPVSNFCPIISLIYSILYYFDSHLIVTPASASYTLPKLLPTACQESQGNSCRQKHLHSAVFLFILSLLSSITSYAPILSSIRI